MKLQLCFIVVLAYLVCCESFITSVRLTKGFAISYRYGLKPHLHSINDGNTLEQSMEEEILMKISLSLNDSFTTEHAIPIIQKYLASFPFSAVLPVQPLTYTPAEDALGVKVSFLRKKTEEKSSFDGGIEFKINIVEEDEDSVRVNIVARRDSEGQFISKVFSEGAIVKSFVSGLNLGENDGGRVGIGHDDLMKVCRIQSIYHKWM